jgi:hypothetical protein
VVNFLSHEASTVTGLPWLPFPPDRGRDFVAARPYGRKKQQPAQVLVFDLYRIKRKRLQRKEIENTALFRFIIGLDKLFNKTKYS